jgi:hypothetical protein
MGCKIEINGKKIGGWRIFIYQLPGIKVERVERDCQTVKIPDHARVERSSTTLGMINALPTQSGGVLRTLLPPRRSGVDLKRKTAPEGAV